MAVFSRYIVGWRVLKGLQTDIVLDALEQAFEQATLTWVDWFNH